MNPTASPPTKAAHPDLVVGDDGLTRPAWAAHDALLRAYYDTEWGDPIRTDDGMFEHLVLETFQAGLAWVTVLRKREALRAALAGFDMDRLAAFTDADIERVLATEGVIRNRQKIVASVQNARAATALRERGGLAKLIWAHQPPSTPVPTSMAEVPSRSEESAALAKALKAEGFTFVGPVSMFALMEATGVIDTNLVGTHKRGTSGLWTKTGKRKRT